MNKSILAHHISKKDSFLCVGLDSDIQRLPACLSEEADPVFAFNKQVVAATQAYAVAYKFNLAFYESLGAKGWESLEKTLEIIPPGLFTIADAKRGDIGNTSRLYARTFFETYNFDAITVAPYMGEDSVAPFLEYEDKWVFLLALTSNQGARDFQYLQVGDKPLYQQVVETALKWASNRPGNLGFVLGATQVDQLGPLRRLAPDSVFLVPGVGAQGGDLHAVCKQASNAQGGLLINSSRGIIFADQGEDFAVQAGAEARRLQQLMAPYVQDLFKG